MVAVHHFVPTYEPGAIGGHIVESQRLCRELGWESEVFTEHLRGLPGRDYRDYAKVARPDDILVYHTAIGSPVSDFVLERRERLVVDHHNLTPVSFFAAWEPAMVHALAWGRAQLAAMATRATTGIADSTFNETELRELGFRRTCVVPILFDVGQLDREVDQAAADALRAEWGTGATWLFVGRIAPNKCHHDLIKAFAAYRRGYDQRARLLIVGGSASDRYVAALHDFVAALQLDAAVTFTGSISDAELAATYRAAAVYVSLSEHEGFCVPLLEAMHNDVPIVAFDSSAVPETLGAAGICLRSKAPSTVAAAVHRVLADAALRNALVAAGRNRLEELALPRTREIMASALQSVLS
jgi:glycosyltransferase involved in cell wall biosynthesis